MTQTQSRKSYASIGHLLAWVLVIGLPLIFMQQSGKMRMSWLTEYLLRCMWYIFIFYINYYFLIDRYIYRKKTAKFLLINAALILVILTIQYLYKEYVASNIFMPKKEDFDVVDKTVRHAPKRPPFIMRYFWDTTTFILITALSVALKVTTHWYKVENEKTELQNKQVTAELANLKNQLNPHFLFNTLNNIYSLTAIDTEKAQEAIHRLSNMLRYLLYDNNQTRVLLNKDIDFVKSYIELMKLRLGKNVTLTTDINYGDESDTIAPLLFISIIENAFKHGINPIEKSFVDIKITCEPHKKVTCIVRNSYFPKSERDKSGSGIGQENARRRLELLYENNHVWHTEIIGNVYEATISVDLN